MKRMICLLLALFMLLSLCACAEKKDDTATEATTEATEEKQQTQLPDPLEEDKVALDELEDLTKEIPNENETEPHSEDEEDPQPEGESKPLAEGETIPLPEGVTFPNFEPGNFPEPEPVEPETESADT